MVNQPDSVENGGEAVSGSSTIGRRNSHCHKPRTNESNKRARRKLIFASCLCVIFMLGEALGGFLSGSLAILTDASHLLSDFAAFLISLVALYLSNRPATKRLSFGWYRAEVVGALISVVLIWVLTGILVYAAVIRIIEDKYEIDSEVMLITSAAGVFVNVIMGCALHSHGHSHGGGGHSHGGGGHSHGRRKSLQPVTNPVENCENSLSARDTLADNRHGSASSYGSIEKENHVMSDVESQNGTAVLVDNDQLEVKPASPNNSTTARRVSGSNLFVSSVKTRRPQQENINVRAAVIHVIGDLIQSIGILAAAYTIHFKPEWKIVDPICTFFFSILVLFTTITILRDIVNVLMEATPRNVNFVEMKGLLESLPGVLYVHNLRIWCLALDKIAVAVHLVIDTNETNEQHVLQAATEMLHDKFDIFEHTIQVEAYHQTMLNCTQCKVPGE